MNIVESKKHTENEFERHSVIVFEEDLKNFLDGFNQAVDFIKDH